MTEQAAVVEELPAADPDVPHAVAAAGIDKLRNRVVDRLLGQAGQVEGHQVGGLAGFQGADDSAHAGLTDNPLFIRRPLRDGLLGSAPTEVLIQAPNALVLGFFDHYLRGRANDFPQAQMARFPAWLTRYDNSAVRDWWLAKPEAQRLALRQRIDEMKRRKTGLDLP